MMRRILFIATALTLSLGLFASFALAGGETFAMPQDMTNLLPETADVVMGIGSLNDLDQLWRELQPDAANQEEVSLFPLLDKILPGLAESLDPDKPLLMTLRLQAAMSENPFFFTLIMPTKDKDADYSHILEPKGLILRQEGDYAAVTNDPNWQAATQIPNWSSGLKNGLVTASVDLESIIETYRFLIEMGMAGLEGKLQSDAAQNAGTSPEEIQATIKMVRALLDSAKGMELTLDQDGDNLHKDFVFLTKPGSPLAPGPQPSFEKALKLTRFLPGGESLLFVSALDQSAQMDVFEDYYQASIQSLENEKYAAWYADYLDTAELSFLPSAMTLRFEKEISSFQSIIGSDNPQSDFESLVDLLDRMNGLGIGVDLDRIDVAPVKGHKIYGWALTWNRDELDQILQDDPDIPMNDPLMSTNLIAMLRFLPGKIFMARVGDNLLTCGGPTPDLMGVVIRKVDQAKGKVDPRLKKMMKVRGDQVQTATVGDLSALIGVILELAEEMGEEEDIPFPVDQPIPFLQTLEIEGADYQVHLELKKAAVRQFILALMQMEEN